MDYLHLLDTQIYNVINVLNAKLNRKKKVRKGDKEKEF